MMNLRATLALALIGLICSACGGSNKPATNEPETTHAATPPADEAPAVEPSPEEPPAAETAGASAQDPAHLDRDQCGEVADHVLEVMSADERTKGSVERMRSKRHEFIDTCARQGTRAMYDCFMAATSIEQMQPCGSAS